MNYNALIQAGDRLEVVTRRADDGTNDGSIIVEQFPGHVFCIAKAPRYVSDEEWRYNADMIVNAIHAANTRPATSSATAGFGHPRPLFPEPMPADPPEGIRDTSKAAARKVKSRSYRDELALLGWMKTQGNHGATDDEIAEWSGGYDKYDEWDDNYLRPRRWRLVKDGHIMRTPERRRNRRGNTMIVWKWVGAVADDTHEGKDTP